VLLIFADIGSERYTFGFTIRDSPTYFINVSSWGREEYIRSLSESFRVGDCGKLEFLLNMFPFKRGFFPVNQCCVFVVLLYFSLRNPENSLIGNKLFSYVKYKEERSKISRI